MVEPGEILSKRKVISALFPYAISLDRDGNQEMIEEIRRVTTIPYSRRFLWHRMETMLFNKSNSPSLDRAIVLVSPYLPWTDAFYDQSMVDRWATAALAVEYAEEVGESVAEALLQIASDDSLRPGIPDDVWGLLKNTVSLPRECRGRSLGTGLDVVLHVRRLEDVDILKSYYLLVWSEWDFLSDSVANEMEISIKEDLSGVGLWGHRKDLIGRLIYILDQLNQMPGCLDRAKGHYTKLKNALQNADTEAMKTLKSKFPEFNNRFQQVY